jgi:hypothetical protein
MSPANQLQKKNKKEKKAPSFSGHSGLGWPKILKKEKHVIKLSEVGFEPTPSFEDQNLSLAP